MRNDRPASESEFSPPDHYLWQMNDQLAEAHDSELRDILDPLPSLHVIGVPRSGTTLLMQLLTTHLSVGYIDRLAAAFWRAPLYGIRLSRMLLGDQRATTYESNFGRTYGIHEPHEFGYFWRDLLGHDDLSEDAVSADGVDWCRVRKILRNISAEFDAPTAHKPFMFGWLLPAASRAMPEATFIWVRRNPVSNAMSLLRLREGLTGNRDEWASMKPSNYAELRSKSRSEQVARQVFHIEQAISRNARQAGTENVLELQYEDLCRSPAATLDQIEELLVSQNAPVRRLSDPPTQFSPHGTQDASDPDYPAVVEAVRALWEEID